MNATGNMGRPQAQSMVASWWSCMLKPLPKLPLDARYDAPRCRRALPCRLYGSSAARSALPFCPGARGPAASPEEGASIPLRPYELMYLVQPGVDDERLSAIGERI